MNLYVIRHADAGNRDEWKGDDADRPLSELGQRQARALGEAFRRQGLILHAVVSSPLVRTRQTAEGFLDTWQNAPALQFHDLLAPGELRKRKLSKFLAGLNAESVAIVGHDPDLSDYLGWLLGVDPDRVPLEKGAAALVTLETEPAKGEGQLGWLVTPAWFVSGQ